MGTLASLLPLWALATLACLVSVFLLILSGALAVRAGRHFFFWMASSLALIAAILAFFAIFHYHYGWIAGIGVLGFGIAAIWDGRARLRTHERLWLLPASVFWISLSAFSPLLLLWQSTQHSPVTLSDQISSVQSSIQHDAQSLQENAQTLSANATLLASVRGGQASANLVLHSSLVQLDLQTAFLTDGLGVIIARSQLTGKHGDNALDSYPWLLTTLRGSTVTGVSLNEFGQPMLMSAIPLLENNRVLGALVVGRTLNDAWLSTHISAGLSVAILSLRGVTGTLSSNRNLATVYRSAVLQDNVGQALKNSAESFQLRLALDGQIYRASGRAIPTLDTRRYAIVSVQPETSWFLNPYIAVSGVFIGSLVLTALIILARTILNRRKHEA